MRNGSRSLGEFLKSCRETKGMSLRAVEKAIGISNPYLSQLEGDKIKQPSPLALHKLSRLFGVPYSTLMRLAGYPMPGGNEFTSAQTGLAERVGHVTRQEEDALVEYLEFLRSRRKKGGGQ